MFEKIFTRNPRLARLALRSLVSGTSGRAAGGACGHRVYIFLLGHQGPFNLRRHAIACQCRVRCSLGGRRKDSIILTDAHPTLGWVARA